MCIRDRLFDIADDVRHASLETHEGGEVRRLADVILREGLDLTARALGALLRQEAKVTVTRVCVREKDETKQSVHLLFAIALAVRVGDRRERRDFPVIVHSLGLSRRDRVELVEHRARYVRSNLR